MAHVHVTTREQSTVVTIPLSRAVFSTICLVILIQNRSVMNGQTDGTVISLLRVAFTNQCGRAMTVVKIDPCFFTQ